MVKVDLSIIITAYNRKGLCKRAIQSALRLELATRLNVEIVVIDDGSNDGLREYLHELLSQNDNVRYFYQQNKGPGGAKNRGSKEAAGKYITFLDSDDVFYNESALMELLYLINKDYDFIYYKTMMVQGEKGLIRKETPYKGDSSNIYDYILRYPLNYPGFPSYIFKRERLISTGGFREDFTWGDSLLFWRIFLKGADCYCIDGPSYLYDTSAAINSVSKNKDKAYYSRVYHAIYQTYCFVYQDLVDRKFISNWLIVLIYLSFKERDWNKFFKFILLLVKRPFTSLRAILYVLSRRLNRG